MVEEELRILWDREMEWRGIGYFGAVAVAGEVYLRVVESVTT